MNIFVDSFKDFWLFRLLLTRYILYEKNFRDVKASSHLLLL